MDELTTRLREDAARIDARVSPELDARIRASLEGAERPVPESRPRPAGSLWWASSLTGVAVAATVIVAINLYPGEPEPVSTPPSATPAELPVVPIFDAEAAVLTAPLEQELADLESDLRKAERRVREDIGL